MICMYYHAKMIGYRCSGSFGVVGKKTVFFSFACSGLFAACLCSMYAKQRFMMMLAALGHVVRGGEENSSSSTMRVLGFLSHA